MTRLIRWTPGFTIVELMVVMSIIGVLAALLFAAVEKARMVANRTACENNLRQIGLAMHVYNDREGSLPHVRLCPDVPDDPYCASDPNQGFTGPHEAWWAPYDNRVGYAEPPAPGYDPRLAELWSAIGNNPKPFQCPDGFDNTEGSATFGKPLQLSYCMNWVTGGPEGTKLSDIVRGNGASNVLLCWDHAFLPGCAYQSGNSPGWIPTPWTVPAYVPIHYPLRHGGGFNALFCDGHVLPMVPSDLQDVLFYVR
jgi:prepilin-type N-terminal cleavage/methylation domain-containing protein/prepilin-type processing-associated H-X9-DG protein